MAVAGRGSELGVELAADEPGMIGQLDHLRRSSVADMPETVVPTFISCGM